MISTSAINFLRLQKRIREARQQFDERLFRYSLLGSGFVIIVLIAFAAFWQYLDLQTRELEAQEAAQQRVIAQSAEDEREYLIYVDRLNAIGNIIGNRNSKREALDFLALIAQPNLAFDAINYNAESKQLSFRAQAQSVFSVEQFLDRLRLPDVSRYFTDIEVSNITRNEEGTYSMQVVVTLQVQS